MSGVRCPVSGVMFSLSRVTCHATLVTCHISLTPTAKDPPPANSPSMYSRMLLLILRYTHREDPNIYFFFYRQFSNIPKYQFADSFPLVPPAGPLRPPSSCTQTGNTLHTIMLPARYLPNTQPITRYTSSCPNFPCPCTDFPHYS